MSWMDEEIDNVFKEAATQPTFEYRPEYWKDIEKQLPVNKKRRSFVWWWASGVLLIGVISYTFVEYNGEGINKNNAKLIGDSANKITQQTKSENIGNTTTQVNSNINGASELGANKKVANVGSTDNDRSTHGTDSWVETSSTRIPDKVIEQNPEISQVSNEKVDGIETQEVVFNEDETETENGTLNTKPFSFVRTEANLIAAQAFEPKRQLSQFYFEINGGIGQEFTQNDPSDANANFGASFGIKLPVKQFTFTAGIGYQGTKFSNLNIKDRTIIYGLGSKTLENSYVFSSIHAVAIPLAFSYSFNRHSLSLGMTTSINFITRLKHSQSLDGERTLYESGVSDVSFFNRFSLQPSFAYSYYVNDRTQIGVRINLELLDQLKSDRFIGEHTSIPFNGQFYLRRTLDF